MKRRKTLFEGAHDAMKMYTICTKAMTSKKKKRGKQNKKVQLINQERQ